MLRWWYRALSRSRHSLMEPWGAVGFQHQVMRSSWGSLAHIVDIPVETATTSRNISVLILGRNLTYALTARIELPPVVASAHTWTDITGPLASCCVNFDHLYVSSFCIVPITWIYILLHFSNIIYWFEAEYMISHWFGCLYFYLFIFILFFFIG